MPAPVGAIYLSDIGSVIQFGRVPRKNLVVNGGTGIKTLDSTDLGFINWGAGTAAQIMEVPNYAVTPFSVTAGQPLFYLFRPTTGTISINPPSGTTDRGTVANQAARLALSAAITGDYCYQTDTALAYCLTGTTFSNNLHWTSLPSGAPGGVNIYNPASREILQYGGPVGCMMMGPNEWVWL
jgi:hypothetical protein